IKWVERYNPANGRISRLPASANMHMDLYPRMFVLPSGDVFWAGEPQATRMLDPASATWWFVDDMNESDRYSGASVLLPGLDRVLAVGGGSPPTQTAEIIDLSEPYPSWEDTAPMHQARKHLNAVLLPDGTMLVVGGGQRGSYNDPVREAELYDPATGTWTEMASQVAGRMYHSTAVLLPDGRVLSAGQDNGLYAETGEIYSPPYLFKGPRPTIASAPSGVAYGQGFTIATPDAADIARVALIKPGSATHGVNFDQRYVDLAFAAGDGELQATAPADGNEAPPGWYMLFVVSSAGVPSVASWVQWLRN
ncbi:MAG: galactose oxidase-like domain-containing protein, partial [Actinomycetota bacterium]